MKPHDDDPFFDLPRSAMPTTAGTVELPILYDGVAFLMAVFRVDGAAAQDALDPFGLRAVRLPRGQAVAVLSFASYRDSTIGPYLETGLALAAVPAGAAPSVRSLLSLWRSSAAQRGIGYVVLQLPVTTGLACAAGRELWGYPKFVTGIQARLDGSHFVGEVDEPGGGAALLRLAGRSGIGMPSPAMDFVLYSQLHGALLRAPVDARGMGWLCTGGSLRLAAAASIHPLARTLVRLGLDGAWPTFVFRSDPMRMRLHAGSVVARADAAPA